MHLKLGIKIYNMKKKVLPQFYRKYTSAEQLLFVTCKAHFRVLKREGLVIIPFAYTVKKSQTEPHLLSPSTLQNNPKLSFIDQFLEKGRNLKKNKLSLCFAVC